MKIPSVLVGVAGEYFVAAELSRRGYIASITLRNTRGIDIVATNQVATRSVTIQCKTKQVARKSWPLNVKNESFMPDDHFYVFVAFHGVDERPSYHIVPSRVVAKYVTTTHRHFLRTPRRDGGKHADNQVRQFADIGDKHLERWDLLGL
jgi:hypothetical protein